NWFFPTSAAAEGSAIPYKRQRADHPTSVEMHTTVSAHPFFVDVAPGKYTVTIERGHEYLPETRELVVATEPVRASITMRRWIDVSKRGWYSGDTHVHRPLKELPNIVLAEDLNVTFPLVHWVRDAFMPPRQDTVDDDGKLQRVDATHVIYPRNTEYEIF